MCPLQVSTWWWKIQFINLKHLSRLKKTTTVDMINAPFPEKKSLSLYPRKRLNNFKLNFQKDTITLQHHLNILTNKPKEVYDLYLIQFGPIFFLALIPYFCTDYIIQSCFKIVNIDEQFAKHALIKSKIFHGIFRFHRN